MKRGLSPLILLLVGVVGWIVQLGLSKSEEPELPVRPLVEDEAPELALLMGDLQRLTHKMALAADAGNSGLAAFYMHESIEQLKNIQRESPEYEGQPVALMIDRIGLPAYEAIAEAVEVRPVDRERLLGALDGVVSSCNRCHEGTGHGLIRITRGTEVNPFNQSFKP
jgi:hypothetical protein